MHIHILLLFVFKNNPNRREGGIEREREGNQERDNEKH
jgi:hypothetical protein